jgi:hypothetical protein
MTTLRARFASAGDTKPGIAATEKRQRMTEITSEAEQEEKTRPLGKQTALRTQEQRQTAEKKDGERNTKPLAITYKAGNLPVLSRLAFYAAFRFLDRT